ncbi:MAG TPA: Abi family protein [Rhizorhapis sp.]
MLGASPRKRERLRLIVLDAIERIEVAIRGSWAYMLAHNEGPHSYLDASSFIATAGSFMTTSLA